MCHTFIKNCIHKLIVGGMYPQTVQEVGEEVSGYEEIKLEDFQQGVDQLSSMSDQAENVDNQGEHLVIDHWRDLTTVP